MSSQAEVIQRLEERVVRVQADVTRELATVRESHTRLERRVNELPQQQRPAALPGETYHCILRVKFVLGAASISYLTFSWNF